MVCNSLFWLFFFCELFLFCDLCVLQSSSLFLFAYFEGVVQNKEQNFARAGWIGWFFFVCLCFCGVGDAYLSVSYNAFVFFP